MIYGYDVSYDDEMKKSEILKSQAFALIIRILKLIRYSMHYQSNNVLQER